jgi:hypothetical protein
VDQFASIKAIRQDTYGLLRLAKGSADTFWTLLKGGMLKMTGSVSDFDETHQGWRNRKKLLPHAG